MKIAIIGPSARPDAGTHYDHTWEIWGINSAYRPMWSNTHWSRMFNLHRLAHLQRDCPQYIEWDTEFSKFNPTIPMYVVDSWKGKLVNQALFPREALAKTQPRAHYHASSFDWLVAYAIHLGAESINIHGAQFTLDSHRDEPMAAWPCLEYWCGYAEGKGIKVQTHRDCDMFVQFHLVRSNTVYGWDDVRMIEDRTKTGGMPR